MKEPIRVARNRNRLGFTMMELLTVIVIISVVMATGVVSWVGARRGMEMRSAASSIQTTLALARQHAVSKRRTTCVVFRADNGTNCYYVFEKIGKSAKELDSRLNTITPPGVGGFEPNGLTICNMSLPNGRIGTNYFSGDGGTEADGDHYYTDLIWLPNEPETQGWKQDDSYGLKVADKMFLPPGISCKIDDKDNGMILFYSNGRGTGVDSRVIKLTDKLETSVTKKFTVYPLVGLVKQE
jgi:prepilin-type N-terminal cleavage/methylation domain-containing protein